MFDPYHLSKPGIADAILIERNQLTSGTTWHLAAQVRALRSTRNLTDLIRYSISLYRSLEEETSQSTSWINKGSLSIATNHDRLAHIRRQESLARLYGLTENGFLSYGHDLDADINPFQAALGYTVDFNKAFIGREALEKASQTPISARIATMVLNDPNTTPLGNEPVYIDGHIVGKSTSAEFGYRVGKPVALLLLSDSSAIERLEHNEVITADLDIARTHYHGNIINGPALHA